VSQIEKYELSNRVGIYVANDASPDDTANVLQAYKTLSYFNGVMREQNLGMNVNIKTMLIEVAKKSDYQLIITDDDYLQPDILGELDQFLRRQQNDNNRTPAIWTPRFSYLGNGALHCVVCNTFNDSSFVKPSIVNSGRYMINGYVLSGLIIRAEFIDFGFWEEYKENAFFPMIFFSDLLIRRGAYYWNNNIVHHTVLNKCHWERCGENDVVIALRLFTDYVNAYGIMAKRLNQIRKAVLFYYASFSSIRNRVDHYLWTEKFMGDTQMTLDAICVLKDQGVLKFNFQLSLLMVCALTGVTIPILKSIIVLKLGILFRGNRENEPRGKTFDENFKRLRFIPIILKVILS
jgi:glycosyltransferase involved in cell wall biosynthesis